MEIVALVLFFLTGLSVSFLGMFGIYHWVDVSLKNKNHPAVMLAAFFLTLLGTTALGLWTQL